MNVIVPRFFLAITALALFGEVYSATPSDEGSVQLIRVTPCGGNSPMCNEFILVKGVIEPGLESLLRRELDVSQAVRPAVAFDSPGGDLAEALAIGRLLRQRGVETVLLRSYETVEIPEGGTFSDHYMAPISDSAVCASACAYAFIGGVARRVDPGAMYGLHQFYTADGGGTIGQGQVGSSVLAQYMDFMGVDRRLLDLAASAGPDSMYWLSDQEVVGFAVDNMRPAQFPWRAGVTEDGLVEASVVSRFGSQSISVELKLTDLSNGTVLLNIRQYWVGVSDSDYYDSLAASINAIDAPVRLCTSECLELRKALPWFSGPRGVVGSFLLSRGGLIALRNGASSGLRLECRHGGYRVDCSTNFATDGFAEAVRPMLRQM